MFFSLGHCRKNCKCTRRQIVVKVGTGAYAVSCLEDLHAQKQTAALSAYGTNAPPFPKSTRARSAENSEPKPPAQQSQTHSGGSRDRPVTAWPYYYDRKQ